jgi:hypothetical protein
MEENSAGCDGRYGRHKFPFQFRIGAMGAGFGLGCGGGIGFGSPLDLRGIPGKSNRFF